MYYHSRPLKDVTYGKIYGNPDPDPDLAKAYRWLGNYCGFFPQVWLARSNHAITGVDYSPDEILFGFDIIKGFPIDTLWWDAVLNLFLNEASDLDPVADLDAINCLLEARIHDYYESYKEADDYEDMLKDHRVLSENPNNFAGFGEWLKKVMFCKRDQVVVPSLNLKAAKTVTCRNEKQKKKLRKMGFIEDRIQIRNIPVSTW